MDITSRSAWAAAISVTFFVLAIGVRAMIQYRRTGASGIVLGRMGGTPAERVGFVGLGATPLLLLTANVAGLRDNALGGPLTVAPTIVVAGVTLGIAATASTFWAQLAMGESWRIGVDHAERTALVTGGPYRRVRNPIYTAMLAFVVAEVLILPSLFTLLALASALVAIEVVVRQVEEPFLRASHGESYARWSHTAGRFVPGVGRF